MSGREIARSLKARRVGRGKYMARCPAHQDRTASLSITEMGNGNVRLHCFAGCRQVEVLNSLGWKWEDLKPSTRIDWKIQQQIKEVEAQREIGKKHSRSVRLQAWALRDWWADQAKKFGALLAQEPDSVVLSKGFHHALDMERKFDHIGTSLLNTRKA